MGVNVEAWGVNVGVAAVSSGVGRPVLERGGEERPCDRGMNTAALAS
jgi:hypothetical protein